MLGTEEEDRWEDEGGRPLDENGSPTEENRSEDGEEMLLRNHPSEPNFLSWEELKS